MRNKIALAGIFAGLLLIAVPAAPARADVAVSFSFFHQNLSPYGRWVSVGSYGQCWAPASVAAGWQPYTVGHWVYTDYGWTWVPADPWGEVTYRYGTWTFTRAYGWVWVPGFVWAPAWVTWSYTDDYIGWAPIPPTFSLTASGYLGAPLIVTRSAYVFVPAKRFVNVNVATVRVPVRENSVLLVRSQKVTRFPVSGGVVRNQGPELARVERVTKVSVPRVSAREVGLRPVRVEAARTSGMKRIPVVAPASAKRTVASGRTVSATSRAPASERNVERERAAKPPANVKNERAATGRVSRPKSTGVESRPSTERRIEARPQQQHQQRKPEQKPHAAPPSEVQRPPVVNESRAKSRPEAVAGSVPQRSQAPAQERARGSQKPVPNEAAHTSASRPSSVQQQQQHGSAQNAKRTQPKKPPRDKSERQP